MKKLFYILFFSVGIANAQIVNIPDANFKAKLLQASPTNIIARDFNNFPVTIDLNSDGEIQLTEALLIKSIDLNDTNFTNQIESLIGIEAFSNLEGLICSSNSLTALNVSQNTNLKSLLCTNNLLTNLDVTQNPALLSLDCRLNSITDLDVSQNLSLSSLKCMGNQLTTLTISQNTNLVELYCGLNQLTNLDVSQNVNLLRLDTYFLNLTTLNVTNNVSLEYLWCINNGLTTLDLSQNPNLRILDAASNQLTSIDVSSNLDLQTLDCSNNELVTLDLSQNSNLTTIYCSDNQFLETVFIKNGKFETSMSFSNNPSLNYVCADENQIIQVKNEVDSNVLVSSYCSFTPEGNYNTITGIITYDLNSDGCDVNDQPKQNIRIDINDGTSQGATFTDSEGIYNFYTNIGDFTLTPTVENPTWFTFSPVTTTIPFVNNENNSTTQNFCFSANGVHPDAEIVIAPIVPARPGFNATYQVLVKNKGNLMLSGQFALTYNEQLLDFLDASIFPDAVTSGTLVWNFADLQPFEIRQAYINFSVNAPSDLPPVNIGDELIFQSAVSPSEGDEIMQDNVFNFNQTVVGSFDPNDIVCIEGDSLPVSEIGEYLHYVINFENTGNSEAENIVVRTEIDAAEFDVNSLQILNTSHNAYIRQNENVIEFVFQNIELQSGGHGNVLLKIKTNDNLQNGTTVGKQANIYFDYNVPIETNSANTTFEILSSGSFEVDNSIEVYPNPTASIVTIECNNSIKSIQLYDVQGRLLQTQILDNQIASIDISQKQAGVYFVKVTSENGVKVERIIKE